LGHLKKKPVARVGKATFSRATKDVMAPPATDPDLPATDNPFTDHANPFVIERIPASIFIDRPQDFQFFVESKMLFHFFLDHQFGGRPAIGWVAGKVRTLTASDWRKRRRS
jgi:hypothetical protein